MRAHGSVTHGVPKAHNKMKYLLVPQQGVWDDKTSLHPSITPCLNQRMIIPHLQTLFLHKD